MNPNNTGGSNDQLVDHILIRNGKLFDFESDDELFEGDEDEVRACNYFTY